MTVSASGARKHGCPITKTNKPCGLSTRATAARTAEHRAATIRVYCDSVSSFLRWHVLRYTRDDAAALAIEEHRRTDLPPLGKF